MRTPECQQTVIDEVTRLRESPGTVPTIHVKTLEQVVAENTGAVSPDTRAEFDKDNRVLVAMQLSGVLSYNDYASQHYERVAAFYSTADRAVTIIDHGADLDPAASTLILAHELIHALQDADGLLELGSGRQDQLLAKRAIIEGEAQLYTLLASLDMDGYSASAVDWPGYFSEWQEDTIDGAITDPYFVYSASLDFVYPFGAELAHARWSNGGPAAVKALYADPPTTTFEIALGSPPLIGDFDSVSRPQPASGYTLIATDDLGWWVFKIWCLQQGNSTAVCESARANQMSGFSGPDGGVTTLWRVRGPDNIQTPNGVRRYRVDDDDVYLSGTAELTDIVTGWQPR